jgi:hypothetical protein
MEAWMDGNSERRGGLGLENLEDRNRMGDDQMRYRVNETNPDLFKQVTMQISGTLNSNYAHQREEQLCCRSSTNSEELVQDMLSSKLQDVMGIIDS